MINKNNNNNNNNNKPGKLGLIDCQFSFYHSFWLVFLLKHALNLMIKKKKKALNLMIKKKKNKTNRQIRIDWLPIPILPLIWLVFLLKHADAKLFQKVWWKAAN